MKVLKLRVAESRSSEPDKRAPHRSMRRHAPLVAVAVAAAWLISSPGLPVRAEETPEGVEQLLARNGIPSIFEPKFVGADNADIPDDAWILGVIMEGEAHAYSLNLLNHHEIVNDRIGSNAFAAVW